MPSAAPYRPYGPAGNPSPVVWSVYRDHKQIGLARAPTATAAKPTVRMSSSSAADALTVKLLLV
jgi:hypothetical protein